MTDKKAGAGRSMPTRRGDVPLTYRSGSLSGHDSTQPARRNQARQASHDGSRAATTPSARSGPTAYSTPYSTESGSMTSPSTSPSTRWA